MKYIYLIHSISHRDQRYIGLSTDLKARLAKHNEGGSPHTSKYKPWKLMTFIRFDDDDKAAAFEQYLKSSSGRALANKHLW